MTAKTRAEQLAEKARRLKGAQEATAAAAEAHVPRSTSAEMPLDRPVRTTLDLSPAVHRDLQTWLGEAAVRLGRARVPKQVALEALVKRLLVDETLAKLILADLKNQ